MNKYEALQKYFGYSSFREGQEEIIDSLLSKRDTFAVMPTGAGKSICFQLPALLFPGITVVVSPLISLMKDQVNALTQNGIKAAYINGSLTERQMNTVFRKAGEKAYKIIYVAPERLLTPEFQTLAEKIEISMLCIDEAHCVSQWGQDFRPGYLQIKDFISSLPCRPVVGAFTATATKRVRDDVVKLTGLHEPNITVLGFDRKNLYFEVARPDNKAVALRRYLDLYSGRSGIVYCSSRKAVEELCCELENEKYSVAKYHAGMPKEERKKNQDLFIHDEKEVMIATNAFGMGIDKSNVSFVIHYNMPGDIESYYQEAGRAGRDMSPADCILLFNPNDVRIQQYFIENPEDNEELSFLEKERLKRVRNEKLNRMIEYSKGEVCLRSYILSYFGEKTERFCGNCSFCCGTRQSVDITTDTQKILSCIARAGQKETAAVVAAILKGKDDDYIKDCGFNELSTFGIMKTKALGAIEELTEYLVESGYADRKTGGELVLNEKSKEVLFQKKHVRRIIEKSKADETERHEEAQYKVDTELLRRLVALCGDVAKRLSIPSFTVFTEKTLRFMAAMKPKDEAELSKVPGVSENKLKKYGPVFLMEINRSINISSFDIENNRK